MITTLPVVLFTGLLALGVPPPPKTKTKTDTKNQDDGSMTVQKPTPATKNSQQQQQQQQQPGVIQCWDDCFDEDALKSIRTAGNSCSTFFTSVFDRRQLQQQQDRHRSSPLEAAIVSLLEQIEEQEQQGNSLQQTTELTRLDGHPSGEDDGDNHPPHPRPPSDHRYVEYWVKHNAKSLEAHRDIDEDYCRLHQQPISLGSDTKIGIQHCPTFGHVFYFDIEDDEDDGGDDDGGLRAPTVVWEEEQQQQAELSDGGPPRPLQNLWTVPAVNNRLLRFRGDSLHAVLYPPLDFLHDTVPNNKDNDDDDETKKKLSSSQLCRNEDGSTSRSCSDKKMTTKKRKRGVLLFNTWKEPPIYTPPEERLEVQNENEEPRHVVVACNLGKPCVPITEEEGEGQAKNGFVKLSVPLLGGINRRGCPEESLDSFLHKETTIYALTSNHNIHRLALTPPPDRTR